MRPRKALIPAAGLGTRFLPATKVVPKELLPIVDRPALEYVAEELAESGIEEIILVIHPEKEAIFQHFTFGGFVEQELVKRGQIDRLGEHQELLRKIQFHKIYQREARGLGHAVLAGRDAIEDEPFLVVLPDDLVRSKTPCARQLMDRHKKDGSAIVAVEQVPKERVSSYGIVNGPGSDKGTPFPIEKIVEKPAAKDAPSRWAIIGRYLFQPSIFEAIERTQPGKLGEIQLTDAMRLIAETEGLTAYPFEGVRIDAGQPEGFLEANLAYAFDRPELAKKLLPIVKRFSQEP